MLVCASKAMARRSTPRQSSPQRASRARRAGGRSRRVLLIGFADAGVLLGLTEAKAKDWLLARRVRAADGRASGSFDVATIAAALPASRRRGFLERARVMRMQTRTGRNWVAGYPELVAQWHPTKNDDDLFPDEVSYGSHRPIWWKCPVAADHEWQARALSRTTGRTGCPCCAGLKVSVTNSLETVAPRIAGEWHPSKNGRTKPEGVVALSNKSYWWKCPKGPDHEWRASVDNRVIRKSGCPFCAGRKVSVTNNLTVVAPELARQWDEKRNRPLRPRDFTPGSRRSVWWTCEQGPDHRWRARISERSRGRGCPLCGGRRPSSTNSLAAAHPDIAREWHPTKNGRLGPKDVTASAARVVWWQCEKGHTWRVGVCQRTARRKTGCPQCAGRTPKKRTKR
jgi:hypothetical protein